MPRFSDTCPRTSIKQRVLARRVKKCGFPSESPTTSVDQPQRFSAARAQRSVTYEGSLKTPRQTPPKGWCRLLAQPIRPAGARRYAPAGGAAPALTPEHTDVLRGWAEGCPTG